MNSGLFFIFGYIVLVGVATFLQKFAMKSLSPFQIEFVTALGMMVVASIAIYFNQKSFFIPLAGMSIASVIGIFFSLGSLFFVLSLAKLSAPVAASLAGSYVLVVLILSVIFLKESIAPLKLLGIVFTVVGVAILTYQQT